MDKEKEIEEMANIMYNADIIGKLLEFTKIALDNLQKGSGDTNTEFYKDKLFAEELINAGYRKADEVRKETAKEIYERVEKWLDEIVPNTREETLLICLLGWIKTKYDVYNDFDEVDE